ncbi:MAG: hypothetical protein ACD_75C01729G0001 [uncultured bacterium]|nr:MAG: hypothetical protein ACD_75C01729G0001 [uncultured bacterium]
MGAEIARAFKFSAEEPFDVAGVDQAEQIVRAEVVGQHEKDAVVVGEDLQGIAVLFLPGCRESER